MNQDEQDKSVTPSEWTIFSVRGNVKCSQVRHTVEGKVTTVSIRFTEGVTDHAVSEWVAHAMPAPEEGYRRVQSGVVMKSQGGADFWTWQALDVPDGSVVQPAGKGKWWEPGSRVMLPSGGPGMTVKRCLANKGASQCMWFDGSTLRVADFPSESLIEDKRTLH